MCIIYKLGIYLRNNLFKLIRTFVILELYGSQSRLSALGHFKDLSKFIDTFRWPWFYENKIKTKNHYCFLILHYEQFSDVTYRKARFFLTKLYKIF